MTNIAHQFTAIYADVIELLYSDNKKAAKAHLKSYVSRGFITRRQAKAVWNIARSLTAEHTRANNKL